MSESNTDGIDSDGSIDHTDPETLERLYWSEGKEIQEIADMSDVSYSTVHYHMDKHDIDRRSNAEIKRKERAGFRTGTHGYEQAICSWFEKQKALRIHRLVAVAEWGYERVADNQVHHINGIPWDNRPENLEVMSIEEHSSHHSTGESHNRAKLSAEQAKQIHDKKGAAVSGKELAQKYGVSESTVSKIWKEQTWKHLWD